MNERLEELQRTGMELYHRCENWKKALLKVKQLSDDPVILRIITETLEK